MAKPTRQDFIDWQTWLTQVPTTKPTSVSEFSQAMRNIERLKELKRFLLKAQRRNVVARSERAHVANQMTSTSQVLISHLEPLVKAVPVTNGVFKGRPCNKHSDRPFCIRQINGQHLCVDALKERNVNR